MTVLDFLLGMGAVDCGVKLPVIAVCVYRSQYYLRNPTHAAAKLLSPTDYAR